MRVIYLIGLMILGLSPFAPSVVRATDFSVSSVHAAGFYTGADADLRNWGRMASETKLSQEAAYQSGPTIYGPNRPNIYGDVMARDNNDASGFAWLKTVRQTVTITDSQGQALDSQRFGNLGYMESPQATNEIDWLSVGTEVYNFLGQFADLPSVPDLTKFKTTTPSGIFPGSNSISAQYNDPSDNSGPTAKAVNFRYQPDFTHPDIWTVSISNHAEQWYCNQSFCASTAQWSYGGDTSYSFPYVYESDANSGNDASNVIAGAFGVGFASYNGILQGADDQDWYQFQANSGQAVTISMTPPTGANFDMKLYDPSGNYFSGSFNAQGQPESISFNAPVSGLWRLQVYLVSGFGTYTFSVNNPDFTIQANPTTLSLPAGVMGTSTITVTSMSGFSGSVSLSVSPPPPTVGYGGPAFSVTLLPGTQASTTLYVYTDYTTPQQTFTATVTATSGSLSHQANVVVTVGPHPPPPSYVPAAVFNGVGSQITVCVGSSVSVGITLSASTGLQGSVSVEVRKDIVVYSDQTLTTLSKTVILSSGNNAINMGSFQANDLTGGNWGDVRQYFIKVSWAGQLIYDPTDPNSREWVQTTYCSSGGGGGSVPQGTLITMANGNNVPVQNLRVGDEMLGYDTTLSRFTVSKVTSIAIVSTSNMLIINTESGTPFRADANPHQTLWVRRTDGSVLWLPVTKLLPGDSLFTPNGWSKVTRVEFAPAGTHVMFDIVATEPYFASGYLDPIYKM
ncbi:hypothetical protein AUH73_07385 [archaeon 13_1_40CM_4_53_4]|nr:MAG: hypothetical protein AUH73_07385 [archaeon 13_1_40CM_4_53_4]